MVFENNSNLPFALLSRGGVGSVKLAVGSWQLAGKTSGQLAVGSWQKEEEVVSRQSSVGSRQLAVGKGARAGWRGEAEKQVGSWQWAVGRKNKWAVGSWQLAGKTSGQLAV